MRRLPTMLAVVVVAIVVTALLVASRVSTTPSPTTAEPRPSESTGSDSAPTSTAGPTSAKPRPTPRQGACYDLTYAAALAPSGPTRATTCSGPHTAQTFLVERLNLVAQGHLLAVDSTQVRQQSAQRCRTAAEGYLQGTREELRLTMLDVVWFTPSVEEAARGADWLRCDVVLVSDGQRLLPLPPSTRGLLASSGKEEFAMCGTAAPGERGFRRLPCSSDHSWRAVASVDLDGTAYPTAQRAASMMTLTCRAAARRAADDSFTVDWAEERPTKAQWRQGHRYGLCWAPVSD